MHPRFRCAPLADKITDARTEAQRIGAGTNLFISGYPKLIPRELVRRAEVGERFTIITDSPVVMSARKLRWYSVV
jgi:acetyl-CoA hydrolase/succinyl-CoA:acetate CoA-transferase